MGRTIQSPEQGRGGDGNKDEYGNDHEGGDGGENGSENRKKSRDGDGGEREPGNLASCIKGVSETREEWRRQREQEKE